MNLLKTCTYLQQFAQKIAIFTLKASENYRNALNANNGIIKFWFIRFFTQATS